MAKPKLYIRFEDIESDVAAKAPAVVHKYRDWSDPFHRLLLIERQAWFSHPFELNDPLDVRPEIIFDYTELESQEYLAKMIAAAGMNSEEKNRIKAETRLAELKANPGLLDENAREWNETRENFDQIGVFSTAIGELNENLWKDYGAAHAGFCVGFKTVEFCRSVQSGFGYMHYNDSPIMHRFLKEADDAPDILYYKKMTWDKEKEFRFITVGVGRYRTRKGVFDTKALSEVVLGYNISPKHQNEIIKVVKDNYGAAIPIFKTVRNTDNSLDKAQVN